MTAHIRTKLTVFEVYGRLQETAPILAWIADQAPSAQLKFDGDTDEQRVTQWFEFTVWFEEDTDEVNFRMFQSEAFEAQAEHDRQRAQYQAPPGSIIMTNGFGASQPGIIINPQGYITGLQTKPRGGK